ncbi:MAG: RraA family protein [Hyphomicrobiaceae bacterium]
MLTDPPLLVVKKSWPRPDASLLKRLAIAQTGHVCDAMDGRGALAPEIKALIAGKERFIGTAITAECGPSDNLAIIAAVARAKPGDVVVAAGDGFLHTAVVGDIVAMMAQNAKCAAILIDGMARDLIGLEGVGLPIYARGITPNSCVRSGPGRVGFPVVCGGVPVASGDVIVADRDGAVVIPSARLAEVVARVEAIVAAEAETIAKVKTGWTSFPFMDEMLASDRVRLED